MKNIICFFGLLFPLFCYAQIYKYIGVEDGLSHRRVYAINKDSKGYMWFLTHSGIDRYDGKNIQTYHLMDGDEKLTSLINLNWLHLDNKGRLWETGHKGHVFCYDVKSDSFRLLYKVPESNTTMPVLITHSFIDSNEIIWLCNDRHIYLYDTNSRKVERLENDLNESIKGVIQIASDRYFIGTEKGVHHARLRNGELTLLPCDKLDNLNIEVNTMYFDQALRKLFIGTFQQGVYVYDMNTKTILRGAPGMEEISILRICPFEENSVLLATEGAGVFRMNTTTCEALPFIVSSRKDYTGLNSNTVPDIYIDSEKRIWMADYPYGVTLCDRRYSNYNWTRTLEGNPQSLVNNKINVIMEDTEEDLWYGTGDGISLYSQRTGRWHTFLSPETDATYKKDQIFITLCEVKPGIVWAAGYGSDILQINKHNRSVKLLDISEMEPEKTRPEKYICQLTKDSQGNVWSGGYYNLKCFDSTLQNVRLYHGLHFITALVEKDARYMWVGTAVGVFLLDKATGEFEKLELPMKATYINALSQDADGKLYIATNGSGLLVYDSKEQKFHHYVATNSSLISNNIYSVLFTVDSIAIMSTEKGLSAFIPSTQMFHNWTKDQGLMPSNFNPQAGVIRRNGNMVFGSSNGAVEFNRKINIPERKTSRMVFHDFKILYQDVTPSMEDSPLTNDIDSIKALKLKSSQNTFSLGISSINYDYPSNILYSWKLEGFYDEWSQPDRQNIISFTNLGSGDYKLRVRAISNEDNGLILEERSIDITIEKPIWLSWWAIGAYILLFLFGCMVVIHLLSLKKQRKLSEEKVRFFINTAHDLRTPITLIKAPLEDIESKEPLSREAELNLQTALRNTNSLFRMTTNLINLERMDKYSSELYVAEYDLDAFMTEIIEAFRAYAAVKEIKLQYKRKFTELHVWFDRDKMDSILKNLISNAIKYTHAGGSVTVSVKEATQSWAVEVSDTGIGIPKNEQHKLFRYFFRAANTINSKQVGSGIGLMLVKKLVNMHQGYIDWESAEGAGTTVRLSFPKDKRHLKNAHFLPDGVEQDTCVIPEMEPSPSTLQEEAVAQTDEDRYRLLIVEDNDELRRYLKRTLSDLYQVQTCTNGKEALYIVRIYLPHLILSDVMMPEMGGNELCTAIKSDIETSHIPVLLLTALNDEKNILKGLQTGADEYITKPFNLEILRTIIANTLAARATLRAKYGSLDEMSKNESVVEMTGELGPLDWKFIKDVNADIEKNLQEAEYKIDTLSASLCMSRTSFYNKIKALTGQAPSEYVRLIRLRHAARMLKEGVYNITEIAERTGFNNPKYFREVFKKYYKVAPSQYANGEAPDIDDGKMCNGDTT